MYEFVDKIRRGAKSPLPSEALQIDGAYIENLIDGYRTLYVTGREVLGSEISGKRRNSTLWMGPSIRESEIQPEALQLDTSCFTSPREFQEKFNKLSGILNKEQAKLIFADEPDKYLSGRNQVLRCRTRQIERKKRIYFLLL